MTIRTPAGQSSSGPAVVDARSGRLAILFPVAVAPELPVAKGLDVVLPGGGRSAVRVASLRVRLANTAQAGRAGFAPPDQPSILLTGRLAAAVPAASGPVRASAVLTLPSRSLAAVLGQEMRAMLGEVGTRA